jgi:Uma2 family endonuclease
MNAFAEKRLTTLEFLAWTETQEKGRYEPFRGEIVAMVPEGAERVRTKASVWRALDAALRRVVAPCAAFMNGLGVAIDIATSDLFA